MIIKPLQRAWNQTRRRVRFQAVCHSDYAFQILSKLIEIKVKQTTIQAGDNLFSSVRVKQRRIYKLTYENCMRKCLLLSLST